MTLLYSKITLSTFAAAQPAALPPEVLGLANESLVDLSAALNPTPLQLAGIGFWPVDEIPVEFDRASQAPGPTFSIKVDKKTNRVTATRILRPLTNEELASVQQISAPDLSKRQFYQGLATDWQDPELPMFPVISQAEALGALKTGEVPGAMQTVINALPPAMAFPVTSIVIGATSYQRSSPLVDSFAASKQMTAAQVSKFWLLAGAL